MKYIIESLDFLSKEENIRINSKRRNKNLLGGFLSLIIICLSFLMIIFFSIEVFITNDPRVIDSKLINKISANYSLSKKNFEFFISLEYTNSKYYLDETIYKVSGIKSEINFINENGTVRQISRDIEI